MLPTKWQLLLTVFMCIFQKSVSDMNIMSKLSVLIPKKRNLSEIPFFNIFYTDSTKYGEHFDV